MPIRTLLDDLHAVDHLPRAQQLAGNSRGVLGSNGSSQDAAQLSTRVSEYLSCLPVVRAASQSTAQHAVQAMKDDAQPSSSADCAVVIDLLTRAVRVLHALGRISNARATIMDVDQDGQWVVVYEDAERTGDSLAARMVLLCHRQQKEHADDKKQAGVWVKAHEAAERFGVPMSAVCVPGEEEEADGNGAKWYFARDTDDDQERIGPVSLIDGHPSLPEILLYLLDSTSSTMVRPRDPATSPTPTRDVSLDAPPVIPVGTTTNLSFASSVDPAPSQLAPAFSPPPIRSPRKRRRSPQPAIPDSLFSPSPRKKPRLSQVLETPGDVETTPLFARASRVPEYEESPLFSRTRSGLNALVLDTPPTLEESPILLGAPALPMLPSNMRPRRQAKEDDSPLFARGPAQSAVRMLGPTTPTPASAGRLKRTRTKSKEGESTSPVRPAKRTKVVATPAVASPRRSTRRTRAPVVPVTPVRPAPLVLRTRSANNLFAKPDEDVTSNKPPRVIQTRSRSPVQEEKEDEDETMSEAASSDDEDDADLPPDSSPVRPQRRAQNFPTRGRTMLRASSPASSIASSMSRDSTPEALPMPNAFGLDETPSVPASPPVKSIDLLDISLPRLSRVLENEVMDKERLVGRWVDEVAKEVGVLVRRGMGKSGIGRKEVD